MSNRVSGGKYGHGHRQYGGGGGGNGGYTHRTDGRTDGRPGRDAGVVWVVGFTAVLTLIIRQS